MVVADPPRDPALDPNRVREPRPVELTRLGSGRRRWIGPVGVVVLAAVLVGAGLWKPWNEPSAGRSGAASGPPTEGLGAARSAGPSSSPNRRPPGADTPASGSRPSSFGLNLARVGYRVERASWGVAAAYVPLGEIVRAETIDRQWVTPVVNWKSVAPDDRVRGPTLDRDETATVALAVTWPAESEPRSVELEYVGPASRGVARATPGLPRMVPLGASLPILMSTAPAEWLAIEEPRSGTLFLPSEVLPSKPADWLTGGWPPGEYAFWLEFGDGSLARLPFVLGG
jgi:hypothetical protein